MNVDAVVESLPAYLDGVITTLELLVLALAFGFAAAVPLAAARNATSLWLRGPVLAFTYVFRGTPLLVQLFLLYYGVAQFEAVRAGPLWPWLSSAWFCAVAAFALNTCAYATELLAGALRAVPAGEIEAARAFGLSRTAVLRRVVLPSAWRRALPACSNEVVLMLHGTSLASVVTLYDLTGAAREMNSRFYLPFEAFGTAAVAYLLITLTLVALFRRAERRWLQPMLGHRVAS